MERAPSTKIRVRIRPEIQQHLDARRALARGARQRREAVVVAPVGVAALFQQQALEALRRVGLLRIAHDVDPAEEIARAVAPVNRANGLVAGRLGFGMDRAGDEFPHGFAAADGDPAQFEMRALVQRHLDFEPGIFGRGKHREDLAGRAFAHGHAPPVQFGRPGVAAIGNQERFVNGLAGGDIDRAPVVERFALKPFDRGITPRFIAAGGEFGCLRHAQSRRT